MKFSRNTNTFMEGEKKLNKSYKFVNERIIWYRKYNSDNSIPIGNSHQQNQNNTDEKFRDELYSNVWSDLINDYVLIKDGIYMQ